jgi:hypothetical protein
MRFLFLTAILWVSAPSWAVADGADGTAKTIENGLSAVPEPATGLLGILGILLILLRRGRN